MTVIMIDPDPTKILVDKAKDGDRAAFDRLVEKFRSRLKSRVESWSQFQLGPRLSVDEVHLTCSGRAQGAFRRYRELPPGG